MKMNEQSAVAELLALVNSRWNGNVPDYASVPEIVGNRVFVAAWQDPVMNWPEIWIELTEEGFFRVRGHTSEIKTFAGREAAVYYLLEV